MPFASALLYDITGNTNNINLLALTNKRPPGPGESEIWRDRNIYSEFFHLVPQLRRNPARFHNYYRMSIASFDYILELLTPRLTKQPCNRRKTPISPAEKLTVTIR